MYIRTLSLCFLTLINDQAPVILDSVIIVETQESKQFNTNTKPMLDNNTSTCLNFSKTINKVYFKFHIVLPIDKWEVDWVQMKLTGMNQFCEEGLHYIGIETAATSYYTQEQVKHYSTCERNSLNNVDGNKSVVFLVIVSGLSARKSC